MPHEKRGSRRTRGYAKVAVEGTGTPGYLRDISPAGCLLGLLEPLLVKRGDLLTVRILSDPEIGLPPFDVAVRVAWTRSDAVYFSIGGGIEPSAGGPHRESQARHLEALCAYYAPG
jgi:hypothetical protein